MADRNTKLVYNAATGKWEEQTSSASDKVVNAEDKNSSTKSTPVATSGSSSKVNSSAKATKAANEETYNTLEGDVELQVTPTAFKLHQNNTVTLSGFGKYLTGKYYITKIVRTIDSSNNYSQTMTVIKTEFADSLKDKSLLPNTTRATNVTPTAKADFEVGDKVRIVGTKAVYTDNKKVPDYIKAKTLTIGSISSDGVKVKLKEISLWTYTKYIKHVE